MKMHRRQIWFCDRHGKFEEFPSDETLRKHLVAHQKSCPYPTTIDVECRRRFYHESRESGICLFCDFDAAAKTGPEDEREASKNSNFGDAGVATRESGELVRVKFWKHIGQHLKSLVFLSLRWLEHDEGISERGGGKANATQREGSSDDDDDDDDEAASVAG